MNDNISGLEAKQALEVFLDCQIALAMKSQLKVYLDIHHQRLLLTLA